LAQLSHFGLRSAPLNCVTNVTRTASFSRTNELKKSCKTLLHAHLRVHIFCKAINRAHARGYCVAAERREFLMSKTAEAATTFVATAEEIASPIANFSFVRSDFPRAANHTIVAAALPHLRAVSDTRRPARPVAIHSATDARPHMPGGLVHLSTSPFERHDLMNSRGP
jgi:hypothetical protein